MLTKTSLLAAYRSNLAMYGWAAEPEKLAKFMASVEGTIRGPVNLWNMDTSPGSAFMLAWKSLGGKGKPTYKALRALPDGAA